MAGELRMKESVKIVFGMCILIIPLGILSHYFGMIGIIISIIWAYVFLTYFVEIESEIQQNAIKRIKEEK